MEDIKQKPHEYEIARHMSMAYSSLFKQKYRKTKPKLKSKHHFAEAEHFTHILRLKDRILDIGGQNFREKNPADPLAHPVYMKRAHIEKYQHSDYLKNLVTRHPKYIPTYERFLE